MASPGTTARHGSSGRKQSKGVAHMTQSTIALIIIAAMIVLFLVQRVPIWVTAILAATAMAVFGIIPFTEIFSALSSNTVLTLIGMLAIGKAIAESGLVEVIAAFLRRTLKGSERSVMIKLCVVAAVLVGFTNALVILAALLPIIDQLCLTSDGKMRRKNLYLPVAVASVYGCTLTSIGASSMLHLSALMEANPEIGRPLGFFEPATVGLPAVILLFVYAGTIGYKLEETFHFDDIVPRGMEEVAEGQEEPSTASKNKMIGSAVIFAIVIALLLFSPLPSGVVAMLGAIAFIATGCAPKTLLQDISWGTVFLVVGSIAIGTGFEESGAAALVVDAIRNAFWAFSDSPYAMCVMMMVIASIISNFMANNASLTITVPIAFAMATSFGVDPVPFGLACSVGCLLSCATPLCNANIPMTLQAGYRFKDYFIWGIGMNVIALLGCAVALKVVYFM